MHSLKDVFLLCGEYAEGNRPIPVQEVLRALNVDTSETY